MEETEAELIVEDGFPKTFVPIPSGEDGSQGPVLPPSEEDKRKFAAQQGSPLRATMRHSSATAETALAIASPDHNGMGARLEEETSKKTKRKGAARKAYTTRIPWNLLDQLEAEKHSLQTEQVNRLSFERKGRSGYDTEGNDNSNPLTLNPANAKSFAKKIPVHPDWPKGGKKKSGLRGDNEGMF